MVTNLDSTTVLAEANERLINATPQEILRWAVESYFPKLTMATAFGPEGCVILHMLSEIESRVDVFNLDTGYQFPETLELRDRIARRYGINVRFAGSKLSVPEFEAINGGPVYPTDPDRCCRERKVVPLRQAVEGFDAWISAIRSDQSTDRSKAKVVSWDPKFGLVKINPLLHWSKRDVWAFIVTNNVPYNPLHDQGFPSIGCWPCTKAVAQGEDDRAGRWAGQAKTECGLHSLDSSQL